MTVLVIDDEEVIRTLAQKILQKAGHTVLTAVSGGEGLAQLSVAAEAIDLVILDANMPGLSGEQTLRQIRAMLPGKPCVLSSGSPDIERELADDLRPNTWFLQKPYQSHHLIDLAAKAAGDRPSGS